VSNPTSGWNLADIWEAHAERFGDAAALVQGERRISWAEFDRRANGIAHTLLDAGLGHQAAVAHYLFNGPEYIETFCAASKAGLVPVNTNYRYTDDELVYLWENADAAAVVFHGSFVATIERIRDRLSKVQIWLWVDDGSDPCPAWAMRYEDGAAAGVAGVSVRGPWGRSGDDIVMLYTGGTTGYPKGVMWRQDDIVMLLDAPAKRPLPAEPSRAALVERVTKPGIIAIAAAPLMHGTGLFNAINTLMLAGCVVTMEGRSFDPAALLATIERERVTSMSIVGDAFAKPIVRALDTGSYDFSSMRVMLSSGVIWSAETKAALLRHNPRLIMIDSLGSSEAIGMATSTTDASSGDATQTASFRLNSNTRVITEDGRDVQPGSGEIGLVALKGRTPVGYYKDPAKSAATFRVIGGERYSIPGDWASVDDDGTLRLLGRGSQCINTGGEKVFPEEVEEALKLHPAVHDAAVVGVPDERFGEAIVALVEPHAGDAGVFDDAELIASVKAHLAAYKAPKRIIRVDSVGRAPNGKLDYRRLKETATST
jgi:3-oxocholest-4-en-26-oate---CoA ligase